MKNVEFLEFCILHVDHHLVTRQIHEPRKTGGTDRVNQCNFELEVLKFQCYFKMH